MLDAPSYEARRRKLVAAHPDTVFLIRAPGPAALTGSEYRADADLLYLTGCVEPDASLLLTATDRGPQATLFLAEVDSHRELFDGAGSSAEEVTRVSGVSDIRSQAELAATLATQLKDSKRLAYRLGSEAGLDQVVIHCLHGSKRRGTGLLPVVDPREATARMRVIKDAAEAELLRRAAAATCAAHRRAWAVARAGMSELELAKSVEWEFAAQGSTSPAYRSVVASGSRTTILHATPTGSPLCEGDLVLVDAGCEAERYACDVTRTFPVSARFSKLQSELYEIVLAAQERALASVRPGASIAEVDGAARNAAQDALSQSRAFEFAAADLDHWFAHRTSHFIGLEVHDAGAPEENGEPVKLRPGMALTVEPGLYFRPDEALAPENTGGLGIRIEDTVLVTESGAEVLSGELPKSRQDIEAARRLARSDD